MNHIDAYNTCHEIMLNHPDYVPKENMEVTYLLIQVGETDEAIQIAGHVIDPVIPHHGTPEMFLKLPLHKQIVLFSSGKITKLIHKAHGFLEQIQSLRKPNESESEFIERIKEQLTSDQACS